jgi:hypothetical protein
MNMKLEYHVGILFILFSILLYLINGVYLAGFFIFICLAFFALIILLDRKGIIPKY